MIAHRHAERWMLATAALALGACTDPVGQMRVAPPPTVTHPSSATPTSMLHDSIRVSSPVSVLSLPQSLRAAAAAANAGSDVVYVSLPPGTLPQGVQVSVTRGGSAAASTAPIVSGGFDPIAIAAGDGDSLETTMLTANGIIGPDVTTVITKRPPVVLRTSPGAHRTDVALSVIISVVFNEPIDSNTLTKSTIGLSSGSGAVSGHASVSPDAPWVVLFRPDTLLQPRTQYQLLVTTGVHDLQDVPIAAPITLDFTTQKAIGPPLAVCLNDPPTTDAGCDLTDYPGPHDFFLMPAISGSRVVWWYDEVTLNAHLAVMMYDLATGELRQVTPPNTQNSQPAIDGDRIVYARLNPASQMWEFYYYDIPTSTETLFWTVDDTLNMGRFVLSGDHAVVSMRRNNNWDIYLYDVVKKTETRLTTDPADQADPSISGNIVTWSDKRAGQTWWDLYMYDLSTQQTTRITQSTTLGRSGVVTPEHIVWGDVRGGYFTLYEYAFATRQERRINTSLLENSLTAAGPYVAWVNRNDNNPVFYDDVFVYDFSTGTEVRLTQLPARQWMPAVSEQYIVWEDNRGAGPNLFVSRLSDVLP